jgi:hypothetical protein
MFLKKKKRLKEQRSRERASGGKRDKKGEVGRRSARGRGVQSVLMLKMAGQLSPRRPLRSGQDHTRFNFA